VFWISKSLHGTYSRRTFPVRQDTDNTMEFCLHEGGHSEMMKKSARHRCGSTRTMAT